MATQLTLEDILSLNYSDAANIDLKKRLAPNAVVTTPSPKVTKVKKELKPAKPTKPEVLKTIEPLLNTNNKTEIMRLLNIGSWTFRRDIGWRTDTYGYAFDSRGQRNLRTEVSPWQEQCEIIYVDEKANVWSAKVRLLRDTTDKTVRFWRTEESKPIEFKLSERYVGEYRAILLQDKGELYRIAVENNPYIKSMIDEGMISAYQAIVAPQLEMLIKAGYKFAESIGTRKNLGSDQEDFFNRLCRPGRNIKEIFKTSKQVYTAMKDKDDLSRWNSIRVMDKFGRIQKDDITQVVEMNIGEKHLANISAILGYEHNNKRIFTFSSLTRYLARIDQYEAISLDEGLQLIRDYLGSCRIFGAEPKIDGDSLKREHDVMARNARVIQEERRKALSAEKAAKEESQFIEVCNKNAKYNYEEGVFFVRSITSIDDLKDEAAQQHNCVFSYLNYIKTGKSLIYVMREKGAPNKSLVTIELSPDGMTLRQKYLAYNRPIHNKAMSEFIERWHSKVRSGELENEYRLKQINEPKLVESER